MGRGESNSKRRISRDEWERKLKDVKIRKEDMNRVVMNFLVTEGYVDAARVFERESGTAPGVDLEQITDRTEIRRAVQSGDVEQAIERVNDLDPDILERQQRLFFHLQQQRLIELIRGGQLAEALEFAQEYLAPRGEDNPELLEELERTVALLVFKDVKASPLADLMDVAQRQKTASELNAAILAAQSQEAEPKLPNLLKLLVWAQRQLDEKATYPHIQDLVSGQLEDPPADN
ncbi:glucose-induced degradation 8-like protein [Micractinium conductrix]|uniref:Glucose-induced degradation 8-like protein n=1 Tax=Micractinium conductrix TaxID=554055 RepID=A0A2P6VAA0_9CHLO|nr:glucose-induced degradation 8-like protein [Micractinium conductrix]|eukprot:PSC71019.1 glucose-induced degradation 8-like protein [Micractinium conductrix]